MDPVLILKVVLIIFCIPLVFFVLKDVFVDHKKEVTSWKPLKIASAAFTGFITDFFDTLGIGSFAPTTALMKSFKQCPDGLIPGTLNAGHAIPVALEAILFFDAVKVDAVTLVALIGASVLGAYLGAGVVSRMNEQLIRKIMGVALLLTAILMVLRKVGVIEGLGTGDATALTGIKLIIGVVCNFILGALMTAGVGLYAPCMALVYMLGLSPAVAFPVMMGSCAFLMQPAGIKFIREGKHDRLSTFVINIAGCIGVWCAVQFFSGLDINLLTWLVIGVIIITSVIMLRAAILGSKQAQPAAVSQVSAEKA